MQVTDVCCFVELLNCRENTPCFVWLKCTKVTIRIILGEICRNGLLMMSFFLQRPWGSKQILQHAGMQQRALRFGLYSCSLLPPQDSVYP